LGHLIALRGRLETRETAVDAFRNGRAAECFSALRGHLDTDSRCLAARAALRLNRPDLALSELSQIDESDLLTAARAECLLLRADALTGLGRFDEAHHTLALARIHAYGTPSAALEADVELALARYAFAGSDFALAARAAQAALDVVPTALDRADYFVPLEHSRARAYHSLGVIDAAAGHYLEQLVRLRVALAEMRRARLPDTWTLANLLMNLSFYVRDLDLDADAAMLRSEVAAGWPADLDVQRFYIVRSLGWSSALRGDHLGALREFRRAAEIAPTTALKVWALADRAYLGRELGEPTLARDELDQAADLAQRIDWNAIVGDDRAALLHLAKQTAAVSPARARLLFESYRRIKSKLSPHMLNKLDRRLHAHEHCADGIIARAEGAPAIARERLKRAFEIWDSIGYRWQAATAAIELAELNAGSRYRAYVVHEAAARPTSSLGRRAALLRG